MIQSYKLSPTRNSWRKAVPALLTIIGMTLVTGCGGDDDKGVVIVPGPTPPTPAPSPSPSPTPAPSPTAAPGQIRAEFSFQQGLQGWTPVFSDYEASLRDNFEFVGRYESVPPNLTDRSGFRLSSFNQSDDVFMGGYRVVEQLRPNTAYRVSAIITIATSVGADCAGVGGAPAIPFKAGASSVVPEPTQTGFVQLPVDKGIQSNDGRDMVIIGDIGVPENTKCSEQDPYVGKTLVTGNRRPVVRSDPNGRLWLLVGTESGFEGRTRIYLLDVSFTLDPV